MAKRQFTFNYMSDEKWLTDEYGIDKMVHMGIITNEKLAALKKEEENDGKWWCHTIATHSLIASSQIGLFKEVMAYVYANIGLNEIAITKCHGLELLPYYNTFTTYQPLKRHQTVNYIIRNVGRMVAISYNDGTMDIGRLLHTENEFFVYKPIDDEQEKWAKEYDNIETITVMEN